MNINRLSFRKFIHHWSKEADWKMVGDITFENCCFKIEVYKTVWSIAVALCFVTLVGLLIVSIILFSYTRFKNSCTFYTSHNQANS